VRFGWVAAEAALLAEQPEQALRDLARSISIAHRVGAPRHVAKSRAFAAVAARTMGGTGVETELEWAAILAQSVGARALVWAMRGVLAMWREQRDPLLARHDRLIAAAAATRMAADLPDDLRSAWLARPDVTVLLDG